MNQFVINTDGGSRGNPGPAALGAVIYDENGVELKRLKKTIGHTTNNQAEYQALIMALEWILSEYEQANIVARLDSELVVKQLRGEYKMKNRDLKGNFHSIKQIVANLGGKVVFQHIPRDQNKLADQLVNEALDGA